MESKNWGMSSAFRMGVETACDVSRASFVITGYTLSTSWRSYWSGKGQHVKRLVAAWEKWVIKWNYEINNYHFPVWIDFIESEVHESVCKSFIQPKIVPPSHRHHVPEPLKTHNNRLHFSSFKNNQSSLTQQARHGLNRAITIVHKIIVTLLEVWGRLNGFCCDAKLAPAPSTMTLSHYSNCWYRHLCRV